MKFNSENWEPVAAALEEKSGHGCISYPGTVPPDLYIFFKPALSGRTCDDTWTSKYIYMPISRYATPDEVEASAKRIAAAGYRLLSENAMGSFSIREYGKHQ